MLDSHNSGTEGLYTNLVVGHYANRVNDADHIAAEAAAGQKRKAEQEHLATFGDPESAKALVKAEIDPKIVRPSGTDIARGHYALRIGDFDHASAEIADSQKRGDELAHLATFIPPDK